MGGNTGRGVHSLRDRAPRAFPGVHDRWMSGDFDLSGGIRRIRRIADLSQRQLAGSLGISAAAIAHAEAGTRDLPATVLGRAATLVGLRLVLLDAEGREVSGMADEAV